MHIRRYAVDVVTVLLPFITNSVLLEILYMYVRVIVLDCCMCGMAVRLRDLIISWILGLIALTIGVTQ